MTQKNKEKIKKIFKRLYLILTSIMSVLFIVICVIAGCGSSNNQQQQVNEQKELTQNVINKPIQNYFNSPSSLDYIILEGSDICNTYILELMYNYVVSNGSNSADYYYISWSSRCSGYNSNFSTESNFLTNYLVVTIDSYGCKYVGFSTGINFINYNCLYFKYNVNVNGLSNSNDFTKNNVYCCFYKSSSTSESIRAFQFFSVNKNQNVNLLNLILSYIDNGYSTGGTLPSYNTITLSNTFYPNDYPNRSFTYQVNTQYSTFGDWYNSGTSPLYLIENSYYGWKGLGEIRYYYSNGWVNVTSNVSLSLQNLELQYYGSDYTQTDLNEQYTLGYDAGYDAGYDYGFEVGEQNGYNHAVADLHQPINLVLPSTTNFMYIYGDTYLEKYLPNVYFNRSLNDFYQSTYDFNDISFKVRGDQFHIFDTFRINFGRISDYNYDISNTSTPVTYLAFVNENVTLYDTYTDYSSFEGCTNYINLLIEDVPASNYNQYYFVKSIQYIDSTNNYTLDVFNGVRTKGDMIYYTQNSNTGGGDLVATSVQHNGTYFVKNGWLNDTYRQLEVLTYSETLMDVPNSNLNNMTFKEFLTYSYEKNMMLTNNVNDIYSLFSGAFGAVGGLLSVQVFPFISLGTLIFTPLIACIIMIIIKILKKG